MSGRIKLGCVGFLNGAPLIYPLEAGLLPHPFEIRKDVPSALVDGLVAGEFDIVLASSIALRSLGDGYSYIPGIGICSDGPVGSVCVFYKGDIRDIATMHLDPASRTGNALAKIVLDRLHGVRPEFVQTQGVSLSPDKLSDGEGCVLIGDKALAASIGAYDRIDLGSAWRELTGLPFVYALWLGREEFITDDARIPLRNARLLGGSLIKEVVGSFPDLTVSDEVAENYLRKNVIHDVSEDAEAGLGLFFQMAGDYS